MSDSRIETLLEALLNGTDPPQEPMSRVEAYLYALIKGDNPPVEPKSRVEAYLAALCEKGLSGGESGGNSVDLSLATAIAEDIAKGKTAYTANGLVEGTDEGYVKRYVKHTGGHCITFYGYSQEYITEDFIRYNDTSECKILDYIFNYCPNLIALPLIDTSNAISMIGAFKATYKIIEVPLYDLSKCITMSMLFQLCYELVTVPELDLRSANSTTNMFSECRKITTILVKNIKQNLQVGSGTSWGHLLTLESLLHLIGELRDIGSSKTLTVGTANLEKLAGIYVKLIPITDEMRAEDDLIDEKYPFEVCESSNPDAMSLEDYAAGKHWQIV